MKALFYFKTTSVFIKIFKLMEMIILEIIHKNLVFPNKKFKNDHDALSFLALEVENAGYARSTYKDAVLAREKIFPTGLPTGKINVAIPHADSEHVITSTLAVMTLREPVDFHNMGEPKSTLPVSIVIMMAIAEPKGQLSMLQKIMGIVQDAEHLKELMKYTTAEELFADLNQIFQEVHI